MTKQTRVFIETETAGNHFGSLGVVKSARTRRTLHVTDVVPYRFLEAAESRARTWAADRGYRVVADPRDEQ